MVVCGFQVFLGLEARENDEVVQVRGRNRRGRPLSGCRGKCLFLEERAKTSTSIHPEIDMY